MKDTDAPSDEGGEAPTEAETGNTEDTECESVEATEKTNGDPDTDAETASTVYTPPTTYRPPVSGPSASHAKKKKNGAPRTGVAFTAVLLALCLILGVVGGAAGMMLVLIRYSDEEGNASVSDGKENGGSNTNSATIYKQTATVNVVELPAEEELLSVAQVYAKVADSVVAITTSVQMSSSYYGGFYLTTGSGSGVILSEEGYVVTNYHVIEDATEIEITLSSGNRYDAIYLDGDKALDIALLKIDTDEALSPSCIGSSDGLVVGQEVVAVGNPLGTLPGTVTDGIVSALNRTIEIDGYSRTLIQTNAAINPGNSGGGLYDRYGRLVGIVNAKESSEGVEGLGFAIPIDSVFDEIVEIIEDGYIHGRASLDLEMREITDVKEAYSLYRNQNRGIYIQSSGYGSGFDISAGDRLCAVNGTEIDSESDLYAALSGLCPGDTVVLTLGRVILVSSGFWASYAEKQIEVTVTVEEYIPSYAITFE